MRLKLSSAPLKFPCLTNLETAHVCNHSKSALFSDQIHYAYNTNYIIKNYIDSDKNISQDYGAQFHVEMTALCDRFWLIICC